MRDANTFYNPIIHQKNTKLFSKFMDTICPIKRLFIVGLKTYACCLAEVNERQFGIHGVHVNISDKNWYKQLKNLPNYKACEYCGFAELNRKSSKQLCKTLIQKFKLWLISNRLLYQAYFRIFDLRKKRLIYKSGFRLHS